MAALLFTNSTAIVADAFRQGRIGLGLGVNQIAVAAGFVLGPVVGGLLAAISWRWVFWFNVPFGIFGTLWGISRLREPVVLPQNQRFDWGGSLSFTLGLGALLLAFSLVAFPVWGMGVIRTLLIVGASGLAVFLAIEWRATQPMMDLSLFASRLFALANAAALLNGIARGAVLFPLIFFLQGPYGKDPLTAGLMMAPFGLAFMFIGPLSGYFSDHYGARGLSTAGLLITAVGLGGLSSITDKTPYWQIAVWTMIMGGGSGLFNSPNTNAIMTSVRAAQRGMAAGIRIMVNNIGQMLSTAIAFPLVVGNIPQVVMVKVFSYGGGMGQDPTDLASFLGGLHEAFFLACGLSLVAAAISAFQPSHTSRSPSVPR